MIKQNVLLRSIEFGTREVTTKESRHKEYIYESCTVYYTVFLNDQQLEGKRKMAFDNLNMEAIRDLIQKDFTVSLV
ncbi:MAG TPA: hypothetical protein VGK47_13250 [Nitrososphaeraceae archaeon]